MIKQFGLTQVGEVLQRIYDSELNVKIYWVRDNGIVWEIKDDNNRTETSRIDATLLNTEWGKVEYSISALAYEVYRLMPHSSFGKWYAALDSPVSLQKT